MNRCTATADAAPCCGALRVLAYLLALVLFVGPLHAQVFNLNPTATTQFQLSDWKSYTSLVSARATCQDSSGLIWVACNGGIFSVNPQSAEYKTFRNTEGLRSLDATAMAFHKASNSIYVGSFDGVIQILQLDSMSWSYVTDISSAAEQYPRRRINAIQFRGDTAFLSTDFGFSLFNVRRGVFVETVDRIGSLEEKVPCYNVLVYADSFYVATDAGVMVAPFRTATLRLPDIWRTVATDVKAGFLNARQFCQARDGSVYALSPTTICRLVNDSLLLAKQELATYLPFLSLVSYDSTLLFCTSDRISTLDDKVFSLKHPSAVTGIQVLSTMSKPMLVCLYQNSGISVVQNDSTMKVYAPNTMYSNRAQRMVVDEHSRLWVATSNLANDGQGFTQFDGTRWHNYNISLYPKFYSDAVWRMSLCSDSTVWGGTWGQGALRIRAVGDTIVTQRFDSTNSPLVGIADSKNYILTGDAVADKHGDTWLVNYDPTNGAGPNLVKVSADGSSWTPYANDIGIDRNYYMLAIDASSTKWLAGPNGLMWFNENAPGNKWGVLTQGNSTLADNTVTALAVDHNGALWIGTSSGGVGVISFPSAVVRTNPSTPVITRLRLLRDQVINDIMIDAQDNKWIGTSNGVWVMTEDGTDTIAYVNHARYPAMLSDNVRCLAINNNDGTVYIGGTEGINAVHSLAVRPLDQFKMNIYPQPFSPTKDKELTIDGLAGAAVVHITTVDGLLVKSIETSSRKVIWDGTDHTGKAVSSGVYLVLSVSQDNTTSAVTKFLVIP